MIRRDIGFGGLRPAWNTAMNAKSDFRMGRAVAALLAIGWDLALFCARNLIGSQKVAEGTVLLEGDSAEGATLALSRLTKPAFLAEEGLSADLASSPNLQN